MPVEWEASLHWGWASFPSGGPLCSGGAVFPSTLAAWERPEALPFRERSKRETDLNTL